MSSEFRVLSSEFRRRFNNSTFQQLIASERVTRASERVSKDSEMLDKGGWCNKVYI